MRHVGFILMTLGLSLAAIAKIPDDCRRTLNTAIANHFEAEARFPALLKKGSLTKEKIREMREDRRDFVVVAARQCSEMREKELQRLYVPKDEITREAEKSFEQAIEYYNRNTKLLNSET